MVIITGYAGQPHITAEQAGATNAGMVGDGQLVFDIGEKFGYELVNNNEIHIKDGYGINRGRFFGIERGGYDVLNIATGSADVKRRDLIVARYEKDESTNIEKVELEIVQGIAGNDYVTPEIEEGNILDGANISDFPLYQIDIDGISVSEVKQLFQVSKTQTAVDEELSTINEELGNKQNATDENLETESKEVVGAINELNSDLVSLKTTVDDMSKETVGTFSFDTNNVNTSSSTVNVKKRGNTIYFNGIATPKIAKSEIGKWIRIGVIPSGFRPSHAITIGAKWDYPGDTSWSIVGMVQINNNGYVEISSSQAINGTSHRCTFGTTFELG